MSETEANCTLTRHMHEVEPGKGYVLLTSHRPIFDAWLDDAAPDFYPASDEEDRVLLLFTTVMAHLREVGATGHYGRLDNRRLDAAFAKDINIMVLFVDASGEPIADTVIVERAHSDYLILAAEINRQLAA